MRPPLARWALVALALALLSSEPDAQERWRCTLDLGDAELPFHLELDSGVATILNADERLPIPEVEWTHERLRLGFPHFDSEITAERTAAGAYVGRWRKQRRGADVAEVPFSASPDPGWRFAPTDGLAPAASSLAGRWRVDFDSDSTPAVGRFEAADDGSAVRGTFLTRTGDYRFLGGALQADGLRLSCFDGAHAFLFHATLDAEHRLTGTFRSGDWWTEAWTAVRDDAVALPDPYTELESIGTTRVSETVALFPDGTETTLAGLWAAMDPPPRAMLVQVLGTWCPNCYDETNLLAELHAKYADAGLAIVGLCFELTGDVERDLAQVRRYRDTRGVPYPLLWAGEADKRDTAEALGLTDRILSYPTTIFVNALGDVDAIHSGFVGPAAVEEHAALRAEFEQRIERLITQVDPERNEATLGARVWRTPQASAPMPWDANPRPWLSVRESGEGLVCYDELVGFCLQTWELEVRGELLTGFGAGWRYDPAGYLQPLSDGFRLWPEAVFAADGAPRAFDAARERVSSEAGAAARLHALRLWSDLGTALDRPLDVEVLLALASDPDPAVRREALCWLPGSAAARALPTLTAALDSADARLRDAAAITLGAVDDLPPAALEQLERLASSDPFPTVRRSARAAVRAQGAGGASTQK